MSLSESKKILETDKMLLQGLSGSESSSETGLNRPITEEDALQVTLIFASLKTSQSDGQLFVNRQLCLCLLI